jgi:hypothetical protein
MSRAISSRLTRLAADIRRHQSKGCGGNLVRQGSLISVLRPALLLLTLPLLAAVFVYSDGQATLDNERVQIRARSEPLAEVLSRFAEATGAEVVYEAARPRQLVSVGIEADSAAEALAQLLEGQGLNYALRLDASGRRVELLVITGSAGTDVASASASRAPSSRSRRSSPAFISEPEEEPATMPADFDQPSMLEVPVEQDPGAMPESGADHAMDPSLATPWPEVAPGAGPDAQPWDWDPAAPPGDPGVEPGQPQPPSPASYPGAPPPAQPVYPGPASYP